MLCGWHFTPFLITRGNRARELSKGLFHTADKNLSPFSPSAYGNLTLKSPFLKLKIWVKEGSCLIQPQSNLLKIELVFWKLFDYCGCHIIFTGYLSAIMLLKSWLFIPPYLLHFSCCSPSSLLQSFLSFRKQRYVVISSFWHPFPDLTILWVEGGKSPFKNSKYFTK